MQTRLLIFDDGRGRLRPLTDLRAVFDCRTGPMTTRRRIERVLDRPAAMLHVPPRLAAVTAARNDAVVNKPIDAGDWLLVNGRWLGVVGAEQVRDLPAGAALIDDQGQLIAAQVGAEIAQRIVDNGFDVVPDVRVQRRETTRHASAAGQGKSAMGQASRLSTGSTGKTPVPAPDAPSAPPRALIDRPWHIIEALEATNWYDLHALDAPLADRDALRAQGVTWFGDHRFRCAPDAQLLPPVAINTQRGPVVIDADAVVNPFAVLAGPCYVGKRAIVNAHASLRPNSVIGPRCKVGGEISMSILHGYSNKQHAGYLGHSLVGAWVNLGGDTNVSNLKNNYGRIRVTLDADHPAEDTGLTFLGPVIGDFTLTAIGSRLLTGSCLGTGTMLAVSGFAPKTTPPFTFLTDDGADRYDIEKFLDMARRMTERRCCGMTPDDEKLLRTLHGEAEQSASSLRISKAQ